MRSTSSSDRRWILVVIILAMAARGIAALWLGNGLIFEDEAVYVDAARGLAEKGGFEESYRREPIYPIFLAMVAVPAGSGVLPMRVGQAILVGAGGLLLLILARSWFGARAAGLAVLVYAFDPLLVIGGALLYSEALAAVVLVVTLLILRSVCETNLLRWTALLGLSLGVLAQIRQVALVLVVVFAILMFGSINASVSRRLGHLAVLSLLLLASVTPWTIRNYEIYGKLVPLAPEGFMSTAKIDHDDAVEKGFLKTLLTWIVTHPDEFVVETSRNFLRFWEPFPTRLWADDAEKVAMLHRADSRLPDQPVLPRTSRNIVSTISFGVEMTLALVGIAVGWRSRRSEIVLLGLVVLSYALGYAIFEGRIRYRIPIMPEVFMVSGLGLTFLLDRYVKLGRWSWRSSDR